MSRTKTTRAELKDYEVFEIGKSPIRLKLSLQTDDGGIDLLADEATDLGLAAGILHAIRSVK